ncbi:MAG: hypothetical protein LR015_09445 [Verrucomicrobia bacterium]|nr:hypothetical protein [Verrucomicrobiota bacterium]
MQIPRGKTLWLQLGWLYVDTMRILEVMGTGSPVTFHNVLDLDALQNFLDAHGQRVAGIVTEIPTNPLIQTTDVPRLREMQTAMTVRWFWTPPSPVRTTFISCPTPTFISTA